MMTRHRAVKRTLDRSKKDEKKAERTALIQAHKSSRRRAKVVKEEEEEEKEETIEIPDNESESMLAPVEEEKEEEEKQEEKEEEPQIENTKNAEEEKKPIIVPEKKEKRHRRKRGKSKERIIKSLRSMAIHEKEEENDTLPVAKNTNGVQYVSSDILGSQGNKKELTDKELMASYINPITGKREVVHKLDTLGKMALRKDRATKKKLRKVHGATEMPREAMTSVQNIRIASSSM